MGAIALIAIAPFVCIIQESPGLSIRPQIRLYMGEADATLKYGMGITLKEYII